MVHAKVVKWCIPVRRLVLGCHPGRARLIRGRRRQAAVRRQPDPEGCGPLGLGCGSEMQVVAGFLSYYDKTVGGLKLNAEQAGKQPALYPLPAWKTGTVAGITQCSYGKIKPIAEGLKASSPPRLPQHKKPEYGMEGKIALLSLSVIPQPQPNALIIGRVHHPRHSGPAQGILILKRSIDPEVFIHKSSSAGADQLIDKYPVKRSSTIHVGYLHLRRGPLARPRSTRQRPASCCPPVWPTSALGSKKRMPETRVEAAAGGWLRRVSTHPLLSKQTSVKTPEEILSKPSMGRSLKPKCLWTKEASWRDHPDRQ